MTARIALLTGLCFAIAGCRHHDLLDGSYQLSLDSVIRDDCNLSTTPGVYGIGAIQTAGHVVVMDYQVLGTPIQMVGNYLTQDFTNPDRMRLDGSAANVSANINGTECLLDRIAVHLDSETTNANAFTGTFSIDLDSARHDECVCQFWFNYRAAAVN